MIAENSIETAVANAQSGMTDPQYVSKRVDYLMRAQPNVSQYVVAHQNDLSVENIVEVMFHASLIFDSISEQEGSEPRHVGYPDLDRAASTVASLEALSSVEPHLASFIHSNIELSPKRANDVARTVLAHVAMALVSV